MEKIAFTIAYVRAYKAQTRWFATIAHARKWWEAGVDADTAGRWANLGFLPGEAAEHIAAGLTPDAFRLVEAAELAEIIKNMEEPPGVQVWRLV